MMTETAPARKGEPPLADPPPAPAPGAPRLRERALAVVAERDRQWKEEQAKRDAERTALAIGACVRRVARALDVALDPAGLTVGEDSVIHFEVDGLRFSYRHGNYDDRYHDRLTLWTRCPACGDEAAVRADIDTLSMLGEQLRFIEAGTVDLYCAWCAHQREEERERRTSEAAKRMPPPPPSLPERLAALFSELHDAFHAGEEGERE
jgi:hypothetical protein